MEEHTEHKENAEHGGTITIKKTDLWKYSTFVLIAVVIIGAFFMFSGNGFGSQGTGNTITGNVAGTQEPTTAKATVDDDAVLGNKDAPVTIIEFSDYQCPFCRKFWTETFGTIKKDYIDTGKVKLVFRDFPLSSLHPMAQPSAEAAECVREKGGDSGYFKFHDKMFSEQNIIDSGSVSGPVTKTAIYTNDNLKKWAKDLGYDISSCLDSGKYKSEVAKDTSDAAAAGLQGTPGFVIMKSGDKEGATLKGAYPLSAFKQALDAEIAGKDWYADENTGQIVVK